MRSGKNSDTRPLPVRCSRAEQTGEKSSFVGRVMTWEEAMEYVGGTIEETCQRKGITVEIRDPELLALSVRYFRLAKRKVERLNTDPVLPKVTP
jgi:hypothetical protein